MKYIRFEDTPVWKDSREFVRFAYTLLDKNTRLKKDFSLSDQFKRAAYSIMLNIAEGFERGTNKDTSHFIDFSKGSSAEVRCILYIMLDNKYISEAEFEDAKKKIENISSQLSNLKKYLIKNNYKKSY
ncbi:MAG: four helix bundle protein [Candidatus Parcubacteria bacterium]|nr:four helix bundle protein [Candidatus Parcubacteria bacterium]